MNRNTTSLIAYSRQKSFNCRQAVLDTINKLQEAEYKITLTDIAKTAGVSTSFIYKDEELEAAARSLIVNRQNQPTKLQILRDEIKDLKHKLQRSQDRHKKLVESLEVDNTSIIESLIEKNDQLAARNKYLEEQLKERSQFILSGGMNVVDS